MKKTKTNLFDNTSIVKIETDRLGNVTKFKAKINGEEANKIIRRNKKDNLVSGLITLGFGALVGGGVIAVETIKERRESKRLRKAELELEKEKLEAIKNAEQVVLDEEGNILS